MRILHVVGARPNFMKVAPVMRAFDRAGVSRQRLIHTGQHYDDAMSRKFLRDLDLPEPDVNLGVGSGSHAVQTARIMVMVESQLRQFEPDWVFTVGDVNSTIATALVAAKLGIPLAHVEAGLRSRDWSMPEEVNRVVTDRLSDALFTTEPSANDNLRQEGIPEERVHFVGNVMIDTLDRFSKRAEEMAVHEAIGLEPGGFVLLTLHRPSNVDDSARLAAVLTALGQVVADCPTSVVLPLHPRTSANVRRFGLERLLGPLYILEPLGYLEFLSLMMAAGTVVTDSGGIQEETTVLGIPCITLRSTTERPITVDQGTNRLFTGDLHELADLVRFALLAEHTPRRPALWDGRAAERIARVTTEGHLARIGDGYADGGGRDVPPRIQGLTASL